MTAVTAEFENALMEQKDRIIGLVNFCHEYEDLYRVMRLVEFATPLWSAVGYGYKSQEMKARVIAKADELLTAEETYLEGCRKNCRTRSMTEKSIRELKNIKACMS